MAIPLKARPKKQDADDGLSLISEIQKKNSLINRKITSGMLQSLSTHTLQLVSKHFSCLQNLIKAEKNMPSNVVREAKVVSRQRTIPRVIEQYQFKKKKPKIFRNSMSVNSFRSNELNRHNRAASFALSSEGEWS